MLRSTLLSLTTTLAWTATTSAESRNASEPPTPAARTERARTERPRLERVWVDAPPLVSPVVNTNIIYVNDCLPDGCKITPGFANSIHDTWQINQPRTLTPFRDGENVWNGVVSCLKDVFGPFGVSVVTEDPGLIPHFEVMIAGAAPDLGLHPLVGGVSPFSCESYISNSLVFAFPELYNGDVEEICATAAQEIAHSFTLDHVVEPSDPLTYFEYSGRRRFQDRDVQCGSDCQGGESPLGLPCSGIGNQVHDCTCGGSTQNSFQTIAGLFGTGSPTPPELKIIRPEPGDVVHPGFEVNAEASDATGLNRVELRINATLAHTLTTGPYTLKAPSNLTDGRYTVEVVAYDIRGASTRKTVQVAIGTACEQTDECPQGSDVCLGGRCVPGPTATGGLGTTCTASTECVSQQCLTTNEGSYCVEVCQVGDGDCPSGFGCLQAGSDPKAGVCYPGYSEDSGGGCSTHRGAPMVIGLLFVSVAWAAGRGRRRRPQRPLPLRSA